MNKEKLIEELSMAVTHSEQGVYSKNEKFVRGLIDLFIKEEFETYFEEKLEKREREFGKEEALGTIAMVLILIIGLFLGLLIG